MRILSIMDPLSKVLFDKDTTFALQRAAARRGHQNLYCELRDVYVSGGDVFARAQPLEIREDPAGFVCGQPEDLRIADLDATLIRKDPPFDAAYLYTTLMLERARGRTLLLNDPRGLRDANEKLYALHFARHMPDTLVTSQVDRIHAFVDHVGGAAVIKPLDGAGGAGVLVLRKDDPNCRSIVDVLTCEGSRLAMVQKFLPAVRQGDKRVLLMGGTILGAINRVPRADDVRSNIHVGGRVEPCEVTKRERAIIEDLAPRLAKDGLVFVGLDMIGERLTEVNVTSPTGIQELSRHVGRDVAEDVIAWLEREATATSGERPSIPPP